MKIYNLNFKPDAWIAWKNNYINNLNLGVTSIFDHITYFNPEYTLLNQENNDKIIEEGILKTFTIYHNDSEDIAVPIFFISKLKFHESIINKANGDGIFAYIKDNIIHFYQNPQLEISQTGKDELLIKDKTNSYVKDFLNGYSCVCNKRPAGINNEFNIEKHQLSSFLIYPISNGSFYFLNSSYPDLTAIYKDNKLGSFSKEMIWNFSTTPLRYSILDTQNNQWKKGTAIWTLLNFNNNVNRFEVKIGDYDNNIWTGSENMMAELYYGEEILYADTEYQINTEVHNYQNYYRFSIISKKPINLPNVKVKIL